MPESTLARYADQLQAAGYRIAYAYIPGWQGYHAHEQLQVGASGIMLDHGRHARPYVVSRETDDDVICDTAATLADAIALIRRHYDLPAPEDT